MALAVQRDTDEVLAGFVSWLRHSTPADTVEIVACERPTAGFSSETFLVDVERNGVADRLVLKLPPSGSAGFPTYDFEMQAAVQSAVAAAGVPAPVPARAENDTRWVGAPFLVMPAATGHIVDEMPLRDHWLTKVDPELTATAHGHYLDVTADINRIDWRAAGLAGVVPERDNRAQVAYWRDYLAWYADGEILVPALVDALDWCESHRPDADPPPSLMWGDVRLGNVVFDETRTPVAVLDWEMATIGAAEHDLAWTLTLEFTQNELFGRSVPGFLDHDAAVARFEARLGRPLHDLGWYEIFAMVRSTAIMTRIAHLHELAGSPGFFPIADNPILALVARRIDEAEGAS